jgi:hypothetical protein
MKPEIRLNDADRGRLGSSWLSKERMESLSLRFEHRNNGLTVEGRSHLTPAPITGNDAVRQRLIDVRTA